MVIIWKAIIALPVTDRIVQYSEATIMPAMAVLVPVKPAKRDIFWQTVVAMTEPVKTIANVNQMNFVPSKTKRVAATVRIRPMEEV